MKKTICRALLCLLLAACLLPLTARTAHADKIYDEIVNYQVDVTPNTEDGSLAIQVTLDWKPLEDLPATISQQGGAKVGIPNGSIREKTALTDNIERLSFDNRYMYIYLDRAYKKNETFTFSYRWVQEYMYGLDGGTVLYDYTPGWFDEAKMGAMTLTWHDPAGLTGDFTEGTVSGADSVTVADGLTITASDQSYGYKMNVKVRYTDWPTTLSPENSISNQPDNDYDDWYDEDEDTSMAALFLTLIITIFIVWVVVRILRKLGGGYAGGFGTRYVFVNHLWYPAGRDGKPRPGSVGTKTRPRPPRSSSSSGFGGGSRGGGFGGGGFGGGGHCACASSCACACACACAGGGRAGCSAKNLYGAVRLDKALSEKLDT